MQRVLALNADLKRRRGVWGSRDACNVREREVSSLRFQRVLALNADLKRRRGVWGSRDACNVRECEVSSLRFQRVRTRSFPRWTCCCCASNGRAREVSALDACVSLPTCAELATGAEFASGLAPRTRSFLRCLQRARKVRRFPACGMSAAGSAAARRR